MLVVELRMENQKGKKLERSKEKELRCGNSVSRVEGREDAESFGGRTAAFFSVTQILVGSHTLF